MELLMLEGLLYLLFTASMLPEVSQGFPLVEIDNISGPVRVIKSPKCHGQQAVHLFDLWMNDY